MVIYQTMCNLLFNSCPNKSVGVWFQKFVRTVFYFDFALEGIIHRLHKKPRAKILSAFYPNNR